MGGDRRRENSRDGNRETGEGSGEEERYIIYIILRKELLIPLHLYFFQIRVTKEPPLDTKFHNILVPKTCILFHQRRNCRSKQGAGQTCLWMWVCVPFSC